MASLDVVLPTRGTLFRFSTPRGEVQIAARPMSQPVMESLVRLGGVLAALVVLLAVRRFLRRHGFSPLARRVTAVVMVILGLIGMFVGVFPLAGVVLFVIGVAWLVRLALARRRAAIAVRVPQ
jgi:hypothetical protein